MDDVRREIAELKEGNGWENERPVATLNNLEESITFMNATLERQGITDFINPLGTKRTDALSTVNAMLALLQQREKDKRYRQETSSLISRLESDKQMMQNTILRLENKVEEKTREVQVLTSKKRAMENNLQSQLSKVTAEKDELSRLLVQVQSKDAQYKHELRKREKEAKKLQERLHSVMMEKNREAKAGMELLNALKKEGGRSTWRSQADGEADVSRMIAAAYEEKQKELSTENEDLRRSLLVLQSELAEVSQTDQEMLASRSSFRAPFGRAKNSIEHSIRSQIATVRSQIDRLTALSESDAATDSEATDSSLNTSGDGAGGNSSDLRRLQRVIQEQEKLLAEAYAQNTPVSKISYLKREMERVERAREEVLERERSWQMGSTLQGSGIGASAASSSAAANTSTASAASPFQPVATPAVLKSRALWASSPVTPFGMASKSPL